jgi:ABC-type lipopolysaccharide export system ATPase subunit
LQPPFCQFDLRFIPCCSTGEIYLRDNDVTILLTEQNARQALQISDYGLVLEQGQTRIEDTAATILAGPRIAQLFLGGGLVQPEQVT